MNTKFTSIRKIQIAIFALVLIFVAIAAISTTSADVTIEGTRRAEMMAIAERYVNYEWTATMDNRWHIDDGLHNDHKTDTPDLGWCDDPWGCWDFEPIVNIGIPYAWGGSTAVEDDPNDNIPDFYLVPHDLYRFNPDWGYFGEKLSIGAPAGDVGTDDEPNWGEVNGVDCIGFVGQVWRRGSRLNMSQVNWQDATGKQIARPIQFKDLRPGDILQRYVSDPYDHVRLM